MNLVLHCKLLKVELLVLNLQVGFMNKKFFCSSLSIKSIEENGVFSGYVSVFNVVDKQNDLILPGAFKENLNKDKTTLLWQHNPSEPIGYIIDIHENDVGLYITAHLLLGIQKAEEVYLMLKTGVINGLSIGYIPIEYDIDHESEARVLRQVELWEVSLVTFPANLAAQVVNVKSQDNEQKVLIRAIKKARDALTGTYIST
nr:HK97 family phage prohead protease [Wolbachia endosymbiont of Cimex lectularius]